MQKVVPPIWVESGGGVSFSKKGNFIFGVGSAQSGQLKKEYLWAKTWEDLSLQLNKFRTVLLKTIQVKFAQDKKLTKREFIKILQLTNEVSATIITYSKLIENWKHPLQHKEYCLAQINMDILKNKIDKLKNISESAKAGFYEAYLEVGLNLTTDVEVCLLFH